MKGQLFEYAVLHHPTPTKDQYERGESPKSVLVLGPKTEIATDGKHVATLAARAIPDEFIDKLDEVEIVVRPF